MSGDHDVRMEGGTGPVAEHVTGLVDPHVPQAGLLKQPLHFLAARAFLERRRRNLGQTNLGLDRLRLAGLRGGERRSHGRLCRQRGHDAVPGSCAADARSSQMPRP